MPINRRWSFDPAEPPPAILPPNAATVYGLDDTQGYDSLLTGQYFQFAGAMDGGSPAPPENGNMVFTYGIGSPEAREAGARFVVTQEAAAGGSAVFQDDEGYVYEDTGALPRVRAEMHGRSSSLALRPPDAAACGRDGDLERRQRSWSPISGIPAGRHAVQREAGSGDARAGRFPHDHI